MAPHEGRRVAMHRYIRIGLWVVAIGAALALVVGGGAAIVVWRQTTVTTSQAAEAEQAFERARAQFPARLPLIQIVDPGPIMMDVRIHRAPESAPRQALQDFHVLAWDSRSARLVRSRAPVWWMHFSAENLLAQLGVPMGGLALTVADVERYGPGIVLDFTPPGGGRVLVWVQ
jgi:hypothetical protein